MKNKNEKIDNIIKLNIQKCVNWCIKYNISVNILPIPYNNYLENKCLMNISSHYK